MAQDGDLAFRLPDRGDRQHLRPGIATCTTTTTLPCKRKASSDHPEAAARTAARRQIVNDDQDKLAHQATQIERAAGTTAAAKPSHEAVLGEGAIQTTDTEDGLLHGDQPLSKNGSTMALPIVMDNDDAADANGPAFLEPEPATAPWPEDDNTLVSPFGYKTWDPTDGGRYELLSTYVPPPCLDPDEEDALWWLAATYTSPELYTSPADVFWGTPDGVWTL